MTANNQTNVAAKEGKSDESCVDSVGRFGVHHRIARRVSLVSRQPRSRHAHVG